MMGYPKDQTHGDGPPITIHIRSVTSATSQDIYNSYKVVPNSFVCQFISSINKICLPSTIVNL